MLRPTPTNRAPPSLRAQRIDLLAPRRPSSTIPRCLLNGMSSNPVSHIQQPASTFRTRETPARTQDGQRARGCVLPASENEELPAAPRRMHAYRNKYDAHDGRGCAHRPRENESNRTRSEFRRFHERRARNRETRLSSCSTAAALHDTGRRCCRRLHTNVCGVG